MEPRPRQPVEPSRNVRLNNRGGVSHAFVDRQSSDEVTGAKIVAAGRS